MRAIKGAIHSISVDQDQITLHGQCSAEGQEVALDVYALEPYEQDPGWEDRRPDASFTVAGQEETAFTCTLPRFHQGRDRIYSPFRASAAGRSNAAGVGSGRHPYAARPPEKTFLPGVCYATELDNVAMWDYPYPTAHTIKGLQVRMVDDAVRLGIGHAALNLNQPTLMRPAKSVFQTEQTITYCMDGRKYYFDREYLEQFDRRVKELSDHNIVVNLILLNSVRWDGIELHPELRETLLHPDYDPEGLISAFNVITPEGLAHYQAFVEFVAERYTRPDAQYGRACGYIIGNEVDAQWIWCNAGEKTVDAYVREYAIAMRTAFYAARKKYSQARVYISLTHHWGMAHQENPMRCYKGRDVIEALNRTFVEDGNWDWGIAYHPYPEDLFHADFWNDKTALDALDTPRITFKNIEVLSRYFSQAHLLYDGRLRHMILSEQGFHSAETAESEQVQAAAYAYAYRKIERTPGIEAFILHAHVDHRDEFGLNLGLWRRDKESPQPNAPGNPKPIYDVFRKIDGPDREQVIQEAKRVVGQENWK